MSNLWQVSISFPSRTLSRTLEDEDQKSIARALVEQRMDALASSAYRVACSRGY